PAPSGDLAAVGAAYRGPLAEVYAAAWDDAAAVLERGGSVGQALATLAKSWDDGRTKLFDARITPALEAILPAGTPEPQIGPARRRELAKAYRDLAAGLRGGLPPSWRIRDLLEH